MIILVGLWLIGEQKNEFDKSIIKVESWALTLGLIKMIWVRLLMSDIGIYAIPP